MTRIVTGLFVVWIYSCHDGTPAPTSGKPEATPATAMPPESKSTARESKAESVKPTESVEPAEPTKPEVPPPSVVFEERIGDLRLGMTAVELRGVLPTLVEDGGIVAFPPDGGPIDAIAGYSQELEDDDAEVSVTLRSTTRDGVFRATSIDLGNGGTLKTKQGIGVGSPRRAVKKAYPKAIAPLDDELWARFSDDEMLVFLFTAGKVERFMLVPAMDPDDLEE